MTLSLEPIAFIGKVNGKRLFSLTVFDDGEAYIRSVNGGQVSLSVIGKLAHRLLELGIKTVTADSAFKAGERRSYDVAKLAERAVQVGLQQ